MPPLLTKEPGHSHGGRLSQLPHISLRVLIVEPHKPGKGHENTKHPDGGGPQSSFTPLVCGDGVFAMKEEEEKKEKGGAVGGDNPIHNIVIRQPDILVELEAHVLRT